MLHDWFNNKCSVTNRRSLRFILLTRPDGTLQYVDTSGSSLPRWRTHLDTSRIRTDDGIMLLWFLIFLLLLVESQCQSEVIGSTRPITAFLGDDVILPCHIEPQINMEKMMVEWLRKDLTGQVHLYDGTRDVENNDKLASYVGRTMLFKDELRHGNISLKIKNVTLTDEGTFICDVPELKSYTFIELTVDLTCLVIPEAHPATVGSDATVHLRAKGDYSLPMWKFCRVNSPNIFFCRGGKLQLENNMNHYKNRITASCENATKGDGSFTILNVQEKDSGCYAFCDKKGMCTCRRLVVKPMETTEEEKGSNTGGGDGNNTTDPGDSLTTRHTIGLFVSVACVVVVVVVLTIWFWKKRQSQQQQGRRQSQRDEQAGEALNQDQHGETQMNEIHQT